MRHLASPHNDQTRITPTTLYLENNQCVRSGVQRAQPLRIIIADRKREQPSRVCYVKVCVLRRVRLAANGGELMWGGLRRPLRPFPVTCVLATAGLAAAFSTSPIDAQQGRGTLPKSSAPKRGRPGRPVDANTVAVVSVLS